MTTAELLSKFADPEIIQTLSASDKLYAGVMATILGMGITFTALILLLFCIMLMEKLSRAPQPKTEPEPKINTNTGTAETDTDNNELIAVISSVIALQLKTSVNNIVIRNIEKIDDHSPTWNRAGIIEQMNNRL